MGDENSDLKLAQILEATDAVLNSAHTTILPVVESGISWETLLVHSKFSTNGGKPKVFLAKKSASSLKAYFRFREQLVAYWLGLVGWMTMYANRANEHFPFSTKFEGQLDPK